MFNWKAARLRFAIVIKFQCDGCMATDHKFQWVGISTGKRVKTRFAGDGYEITIIKRNEATDFRDHSQGTEIVIIDDGSLQQVAPGLFLYFK